MKAQRENREEKFKQEEREKLRAKRAARLDDDMDDYFSKRSQKVEQPETDAAKEKTPPVQSEQNKTEASAQEQSAPEQSLPEQPAAST